MKKVLVVDDVKFNRELLLARLRPHFDVLHTAADGCEAVEAFINSLDEQEPYDLICLDIMMPVMDGQAALVEIRKIEEERGMLNDMVKVLIVTAIVDEQDKRITFLKGLCDGFLTKPLSPVKLLEYLKEFGLCG